MILCLMMVLQGIEAKDRCVLVGAEVRAAPPRVSLRWPADPKAVEYMVYRRGPAEAAWGGSRGRVEAGATGWDDDDVKLGETYEYKVLKTAKVGDKTFEGTGYLRAGIEVGFVDVRGKVLVLVDAVNAKALDFELKRLDRDLEGDGWIVARREVSPTAQAAEVKALIRAEPGLRSVFLLGRLPVVRSGFMAPDGHPDHRGPWPADAFYGDLDGEWGDAAVDKPEKNVPGDGKLDPSQLPSEVELEVGRVDVGRLPAFGKTEPELLRRYLDRNHTFRHKKLEVERRALICDQFGDFRGEAFVSGSWRNFAALVGPSKIETGAYFEKLGAGSYLWAHGSGAGSWQSCAGVGTTADFAAKPAKAVFISLFGSYFGDWDSENALLRAPLAADGYALAVFWSGRPHWYAQALALGEPLGAAARATQNNRGLYAPAGSFARGVHVSLMGDPTLRIHPVAPPGPLVRGKDGLTWTASADATSGYHVYRKDGAGWTRLSAAPTKETCWAEAKEGTSYMVRALRLESGGWGSYLNASQGSRID
jgi:hypothetical protein